MTNDKAQIPNEVQNPKGQNKRLPRTFQVLAMTRGGTQRRMTKLKGQIDERCQMTKPGSQANDKGQMTNGKELALVDISTMSGTGDCHAPTDRGSQ